MTRIRREDSGKLERMDGSVRRWVTLAVLTWAAAWVLFVAALVLADPRPALAGAVLTVTAAAFAAVGVVLHRRSTKR